MVSLAAFLPSSPPSPPLETPFKGVVQQDDLFEVLVEDDFGNMSFCPAVVWSVLDDGFEVYYLTRCHPMHAQPSARSQDQMLHVLEDHFCRIPWQSVNAHVPLSQFDGTALEKRKRAFKKLGFRDLGTSNGFYKILEESLLETVPALRGRQVELGDLDSDSDSNDDTEMESDEDGDAEVLDADGNLADLVAPESEVELFSPATGTAFAEDMNRAQQQFDAWVPTNPSQQRTKDLIQSMDVRISRQEANRAWAMGRAF